MDIETFGFEEGFQKNLVAAVLKDPTFLKQYDDVLIPSYFDYPLLTSISRIAKDLLTKFGEVPNRASFVEAVKEHCANARLPGNEVDIYLSAVHELYSLEVYDLSFLADKIVTFGRRQALRQGIMKVVPLLQTSREDSYEKSKAILEKSLQVGVDSRDLGTTLKEAILNLPMLAAQSPAGATKHVPTGFPTIDRHTMGGPGRGEVWVVMGFPGRGKSTFLINIGVSALKFGYPVFHYTIGDLDRTDVLVRYTARLCRLSTFDVINGSEAYWSQAHKLAKLDKYLRVMDYPSGKATMDHIRAHAAKTKVVDGVSPAVMIIDYPEELRPSSTDMYVAGGDYYTSMGAMSRDFDCLVWAASQVQRVKLEHEFDVITMENIAESWKKPQKADGIVSWNMTYKEESEGKGRLWVDKTRRAKSYYLVNTVCDLAHMSIWEKSVSA